MIDLYAPKQICCEHCGFGFFFTEFGSAAVIVCPACGEENVLPIPSPEPVVEQIVPPASESSPPEVPQPEFPDLLLPQPVSEKQASCSVDHCPLFTGDESNNTAAEITEQLGLRLLKRKKRRKTILVWTITMQICVLCSFALFIAKTYWIPKETAVQETSSQTLTVDTAANTEIIDIVSPPFVHSVAQPALLEEKSAHSGSVPYGELPAQVTEPQPAAAIPAVASSETVPGIFPPPLYDYALNPAPPSDVPITTPGTLTSDTEFSTIPPPLPTELVTLDMADNLLESAKTVLVTNPESSVEQVVRAAKIYDQYGHSYPDSMYWILGSAFASLSWGEPLLESSPAIETMTVSPDNRYLLTQLADKKVWLWDLQNLSQERSGYVLDQGTTEYVKFVFTPDLRWIIGGQKNGTIRIWDMTLKNPADTIVTFAERIPDLQDIQISANGQWLAAFGHAPLNIVRADQSQPGKPVQQVNYQHKDRFENFSSSPYPVLLWNLRQMTSGIVPMAITIPSMPQPVQVIEFSPNSDRIAVGRKDSVVRVYDLSARGINEEPFILQGHQLGITQIAFAPSGQWIATGSQDNTVRLWNLASSKVSPESATLYGHIGWIKSLTIDAAGEYIFSGSYDRTIRVWNVKHNHIGTALKNEPIVLETPQGIPETLLITPDSKKMIVLGNEGSLGIYHLPSVLANKPEEILQSITFHNSKLSVSKCRITSDNRLLIFSYNHLADPSNNGIRLWALQPEGLIPPEATGR